MIYVIVSGLVVLLLAIAIIVIQFLKKYLRCKKSYDKFQHIFNKFPETFDALNLIIRSENNEYSRLIARTRRVWKDAVTLGEIYFAAHLLEGALKVGVRKAGYSDELANESDEKLEEKIRSEKREFLFRLRKLNSQAKMYYETYGRFIPLKFLPEEHLLPDDDELWNKSLNIRDKLLSRVTYR